MLSNWDIDAAALQEDVLRACPAGARVVVGLIRDGSATQGVASADSGGKGDSAGYVKPAPIGCVTKVLTAMLAVDAAACGRLNLEASVGRLLGTSAPSIASVSVRSLLNHTHGLDGSLLMEVPRNAAGMLDPGELIASFERDAVLFEPGSAYSYSNVGAWLAACILERIYATKFEVILRERLLSPLQMPMYSGLADPNCRVCPALGRDALQLSVEELLRVLKWHLLDEGGDPPTHVIARMMTERALRLPGHGRAEGAGLGWKYFGNGWYGHNGRWHGISTALRFNVESKVSLVVRTWNAFAATIMARLFGHTLPEFSPTYSSGAPVGAYEDQRNQTFVTGIFQNQRVRIQVTKNARGDGELWASYRREATAGYGTAGNQSARLVRVGDDSYALKPQIPGGFQWVQFISAARGDRLFLWNGNEVLPRVSAS